MTNNKPTVQTFFVCKRKLRISDHCLFQYISICPFPAPSVWSISYSTLPTSVTGIFIPSSGYFSKCFLTSQISSFNNSHMQEILFILIINRILFKFLESIRKDMLLFNLVGTAQALIMGNGETLYHFLKHASI